MTVRQFSTLRAMEGMLILGPLFLLGASAWAVRNAIILHRDVSVAGTVTDVFPTSPGSQPFYKTTFTFTATDGKSHTVTPSLNESPAPYKIGDSVSVVYNPADPNDASISSAKEMWRIPIHFGVAGMIALLLGLFLWKRNRSAYASDLNVTT